MSIVFEQYGKSRVRVLRVRHLKDRDEVTELTVNTRLSGDFEDAYRSGDNNKVVPTDTQKNTVYALAKKHGCDGPESFGMILCKHFLEMYPWVLCATVEATEHTWHRMSTAKGPHAHSFSKSGPEVHSAVVRHARGSTPSVRTIINQIGVLKTTASGFSNFHKCEFTTLQDTNERIFSTDVKAEWEYTPEAVRGHADGSAKIDFAFTIETVRSIIFAEFSEKFSKSVQQTLYDAGALIIKKLSSVDKINIVMPNNHYVLADLTPFGMKNPHEVYVPLSDPSGYIEGTVGRPRSRL